MKPVVGLTVQDIPDARIPFLWDWQKCHLNRLSRYPLQYKCSQCMKWDSLSLQSACMPRFVFTMGRKIATCSVFVFTFHVAGERRVSESYSKTKRAESDEESYVIKHRQGNAEPAPGNHTWARVATQKFLFCTQLQTSSIEE